MSALGPVKQLADANETPVIPVTQLVKAKTVGLTQISFEAIYDTKLYRDQAYYKFPLKAGDYYIYYSEKSGAYFASNRTGHVEGLQVISGKNLRVYMGECH